MRELGRLGNEEGKSLIRKGQLQVSENSYSRIQKQPPILFSIDDTDLSHGMRNSHMICFKAEIKQKEKNKSQFNALPKPSELTLEQ